MGTEVLAELLAKGAALFAHQDRLLRLRFSEASGIPPHTLLPQAVSGEEGLSRCYRYAVDCLAVDSFVELKDFLGQPMEIGLLLADGGERLLTGLVTRAESLGGDGGFAHFRLTVEPALATLAHRRNSRVFADQSVPEIIAALLDEHLAANPAFAASFTHEARLTQTHPSRSYCLQYRESDLAFIERLLAEEGISYRFSHGPDTETSLRDAFDYEADLGTPQHTLILFDAGHPHAAGGTARLRFHRTEGPEAEDAIDRWEGARQLQSGQSSLLSYDYKAASPYSGEEAQRIRHGNGGDQLVAHLEDYDPQALYYGSDTEAVARYARLRQQAKDLAAKAFAGEGSARALEVGRWFELAGHPVHDQDRRDDRQFLVTGIAFTARNNLLPDDPPGFAALLTGAADGSGQSAPPYRNSFTAVRRHIPIVPAYQDTRHQKPTAPGSTTATVVGPAGEEIYTDELGRIKLHFHWQRPQDHPAGSAAFNERSSTWVRVAFPSAGATWGSQYIPRVGQEVVVSFLEGDIDRPLVTGVVYNGRQRPPSFSGAAQLPADKALSGVKSKEVQGRGYNELLFDDTPHELRAKLSSEHGTTQLNQGYLIHPRRNGEGEARGEGFELRTDHHGVLRAAQGLLLTTEAQRGAAGKQLAREQAMAQLDAALALSRSLGETATRQQADTAEHGPRRIGTDNRPSDKAASGHLQHHVAALQAWEAGSNTDKEAKTAIDEPGQQPLLVLSAPAGIASVTGQNQTLATGANLDLVAQRDTNQTSGRRWLHNVGQHLSLFVQGVNETIAMKLIAAQGKVQLQAQSDSIEVTADQDVTVTARKGKVTVSAKDELLLTAGGGYIRIANGNIEIHCPGTVSSKGASHQLNGPTSLSKEMNSWPRTNFDKDVVLKLHTGEPASNRRFRIQRDDGTIISGTSDEQGRTGLQKSDFVGHYTITILE